MATLTDATATPPHKSAGSNGQMDQATLMSLQYGECEEVLQELSNLQAWCALMARKDSGGLPAADLIQRTRILIIEQRKALGSAA